MPKRNIENIKSLIDEYEYISLDIFDTLTTRATHHPADVFSLMQEEIKSTFPIGTGDFAEERIRAERNARLIAAENFKEEISIDEIYTQLEKQVSITKEVSEQIKSLEQLTEIALSMPTSFCRLISNYLKNSGKSIVLTSDMYLDRMTIEAILKKNGIEFHDRLILSCEEGKTKHSGELFQVVIDHFGCSPEEIMHIGDNLVSDKLNAQKAGLHEIHLPATKDAFDRNEIWTETSLFNTKGGLKVLFNSQFVQKIGKDEFDERMLMLSEDRDYFLRCFGELIFAPLLLSLVIWIKKSLGASGSTKILFLARDGQVVKQAFDAVFKGKIDSEYVYASRRMLTLPFEVLSGKEISNFFVSSFENSKHLGELLQNFPSSEKLKKRLGELGYEQDLELNKNNISEIKQAIIENSGLIHRGLGDDRMRVSEYFVSRLSGHDKVAIFDLGWRGSLQKAISRALPDKGKRIHGFYFGTTWEVIDKLLKSGLNYSSYSMHEGTPEYYRHGCQSYTDVIEFLFSADHASCKTVSKNSNGEYSPEFMEISEAEQQSQESAKLIQAAALSAIDDLLQVVDIEKIERLHNKNLVISDFVGFLDNPGVVAANHFSEVRVFSGIGDQVGIPLIDQGRPYWVTTRFDKTRWKSAFLLLLSRREKNILNWGLWFYRKFAFVRYFYDRL